jgi:pantoate--beta-alanine ligase
MKVIQDIYQMQNYSDSQRGKGDILGLVPTMGYLHQGHLSLMRIMRTQCDQMVVSIFVNPTQFAPSEDLDRYPRDFERDLQLCQLEKVDVIFYPSADQMYPPSYYTYVNVEKITRVMCGKYRPGHFKGVTTVVTKLFNIVKPHIAIFGEKDYQQLRVIQQMVKDLNFDIQILNAPIVREPDGLAMSSRNEYLNKEEREKAIVLYKSLQLAKKLYAGGERDCLKLKRKIKKFINNIQDTKIEYVEILDPTTLESISNIKDEVLVALAVYIGRTRLIDNMTLKSRS